MDHLTTNSTIAVATEVRVNPAFPVTALVEFMAKWLNLYPSKVRFLEDFGNINTPAVIRLENFLLNSGKLS